MSRSSWRTRDAALVSSPRCRSSFRNPLEERKLTDQRIVASRGRVVASPSAQPGRFCWMAKFDISPVTSCDAGRPAVQKQTTSPPPAIAVSSLILHGCATKRAVVGTIVRGVRSPARGSPSMCACFLGVTSAVADPTDHDSAIRRHARIRRRSRLRGFRAELGPRRALPVARPDGRREPDRRRMGLDGRRRSSRCVRVREREALAAIGGSVGASMWTERGGGRIWARRGRRDAASVAGWSARRAGPIVELSDVAHPRVGGIVGVLGFVGVTPFARVGIRRRARGLRRDRRAHRPARAASLTVDICAAGGLPSTSLRGVAQPGSALGSGPRSRRFKSCRPDYRGGIQLTLGASAESVSG